MPTLELVRGDVNYDLEFTIRDAEEALVDLTNSTVKFKCKKYGATSVHINEDCTLAGDPTTGVCYYTVTDGDFDTIGTYRAELEVTWTGGKVLTAKDLSIIIEPDIS